jgi:AmiR/NasT family two-component response regulator
MNVYAHAKNVFDQRAAELGELFAAPAAIAVQNAQVLEQTKRLAATLQAVLTNRAIIDQALGIIRSRSGLTSDEAYQRLREMSQSSDTKLVIVAQSVVGEAVRRAIARRNTH